MDLDGLVVIALAGLWIAYLVPQHLRHRQQLLEARADDRFSDRLRVLRVAEGARVLTAEVRLPVASPERVLLHPPRRRGDGTMHRPHAAADRVSADAARRTAGARAARAASLARRSAAARRRALLAVLLLLASVAGWAGVAVAGAALALGAVPSVLLLAVLGLGRRAVRAGRRADAAWATGDLVPAAAAAPARVTDRAHGADPVRTAVSARTPQRVPAAAVVGRAVHPSEAVTEVIVPERAAPPAGPQATAPRLRVDVSGDGSTGRPAAPEAVDADPLEDSGVGTWVPVPVPPPAYTLKPAARRAEPAPLPVAEPDARVVVVPAAGAEPRPTTGGLELDAILARRRAAGE